MARPLSTDVTIADRSKLFAARLGDQEEGGEQAQPQESKFGITVRSITQDMASRYSAAEYQRGHRAGRETRRLRRHGGLSRGDVILEINKQPVNSEDDFQKARVAGEERTGRRLPGSSARHSG